MGFVLHLGIKGATNVDILSRQFVHMPREYWIIVSESIYGSEFRTRMISGNHPQPRCDYELKVEFQELPNGESLYVEVLGLQKDNNVAGTSAGLVVLGRAQIPMPNKSGKNGWRLHELVKLVGSEKKIEGFVLLYMELKLK